MLAIIAIALSSLLPSAPAAPLDDLIFADSFDGDVCANGCPPAGWQYRQLTWFPSTFTQCTSVNVYGIAANDPLLVTTCAPTPAEAGSGDTVISSVLDINGLTLGTNDDCVAQPDIPQLFYWTCADTTGQVRMSCVPQSGFGVSTPSGVRITITVCPLNAGSSTSAPLYIWWNGTSNPNPG